MADTTQGAAPAAPEVRDRIATRVLGGGALAVALVGVVAICAEKSPAAQQVFTAVITLVGSWGGAVIAFYFSRENFEAASRHTERALDRLSGDVVHSLKLSEVMLPIAKVESLAFKTDPAEISLEQIRSKFEGMSFERLLLLDGSGVVRQVLHLSSLNNYLVRHPQTATGGASLKDLIADAEIGPLLVHGFRTLRGDNTLADAKLLIEKNASCQDVVITDNGEPGGRAIGWISNNAILEKSRA